MIKSPLLLLLLMSWTAFAQQPIFTQAQISNARVYYNGAELYQNAKVEIPQGQSEIVITNIADQVNTNSIQIGSDKPFTLLSVQYSNAYVEEYDNAATSPLHKSLRDSIQWVEKELDQIKNSINTDEQTIKLLDANGNSQSDKSIKLSSVNEMKQWVDYYQDKRAALQNGLYSKKKNKEEIEKKLNRLKSQLQLNTDPASATGKGKLIVQVMSEKAQTVPLKINYLTNNAGWMPSYDLAVKQINSPIEMTFKADVKQNTGIDWKQVQLSLTSGTVNQNQQLPELGNWFIGYEKPRTIALEEVAFERSAAPQSKYTALNAASADQVQGVEQYTQVQENQLNTTYQIDLAYTVLSNNKAHSVNIQKFDVPATYQYYAVPKMSSTAFLMAKISDYNQYNLLSGNANIIFEGMYVGKTFLNTDNTANELKLNLGDDPQISIKRTKMADKSGIKFLSSKKEQNFEYEISVKNNKNKTIEIELEDQYPISKDNSIEVVLTESSKAKVNSETGKLTWQLKLKPGEKKDLKLAYKVKSDKDKEIDNL